MFETIYGNNYPKKLIESMINQNRLIHTIILSGENGLGKLTFAKEIAREILYHWSQNKFVKNCLDINIIDGNKLGSIVINNIREIKNNFNVTPHEGEKKVQIIANCDKMTVAAQNALLKSLEEPSKSTIFILTTSNIHKLLDTILSRAMIINIQKIPDDEIEKILLNKYPQIKTSDIIRYTKILGGNLGLITSILESKEKENILNLCEDFLFYIITHNQFETIKILSKYKTNKSDFTLFLELFKIYFEKVLKIYLSKNTLTDIIKNHDPQYFSSLEDKLYIFDIINKSLNYISSNVNLGLLLTWLNINISYF